MTKIISWNVNGLRAVYKKNFLGWLLKSRADIVCLQETKLQKEQIPKDLLRPGRYYSYFSFAEKKGYSGVAIYTKEKPKKIERKIGMSKFDQEGRVLKLDFADFTLFNFYIPHGGRKKENLKYKLSVYDFLLNYFKKFKDKKIILMGDFNIARQEIDLARPKQNKNNIMFTKEEREKVDKLIGLGFADSFRMFNKEGGNYTWWPYFANARERNLGWRIDYAFASSALTKSVKEGFILNKVIGSDHCPLGLRLRNLTEDYF